MSEAASFNWITSRGPFLNWSRFFICLLCPQSSHSVSPQVSLIALPDGLEHGLHHTFVASPQKFLPSLQCCVWDAVIKFSFCLFYSFPNSPPWGFYSLFIFTSPSESKCHQCTLYFPVLSDYCRNSTKNSEHKIY